MRLVTLTLAALSAAFLLGFAWFVHSVPRGETPAPPKADGIVVLTGGAARINDGVDLLAHGHGRRLLITGVNPVTRAKEIAALTPENERWFRCCIDLDYSAQNTLGNALEARRWAQERGFRSLVLVTSNFHMPRSLAELRHQLPEAQITAYPVVSGRVRVENWISDPAAMRALVSEYLKFVVAAVRMRLPNG